LRELDDGGNWDTLAGQPTDDSELALALARSILQVGRYDPEAAVRAYAFWYRSNPFDIGGTIHTALLAATKERIAAGTAAAAARQSADRSSQANGALMRISPLGIWGYARAPEELAGCARADSQLTHPHPVCREVAAAYVMAIAHAIFRGDGPQAAYEAALAWARAQGREAAVRQALERAPRQPPADYQTARRGWVLVAFQNAFCQLLHAPDLEEGVVRTVMAGGDTDTNAAVAGALLGAVHGRAAIPLQWRQMVLSCRPIQGLGHVRHPRPRAFWPVDALELAERLLLAGSE